MTSRLKLSLVVLVALGIQTAVLHRLAVFGVHPDLMLLVAVTAGLLGGTGEGALVGFGAGLAIDVYLQTPMGLSAFAFALAGYGAGRLGEATAQETRWVPVLTVMIGTATGMMVFAAAGALVGRVDLLGPRLALVLAVVVAVNGVLAPLALRVMGWALGDRQTRTKASVL
jgi:rod shape-determining protein MreD